MTARRCLILLIASFPLLFNLTSGKRIPFFAGPYTIIMRTSTNESDEFKSSGKVWLRLHFTHPRPKQLQYAWGHFYASVPLTNEGRVEIRLSSRSNNEWKRNAFVFKFDKICDAGITQAKFFPTLVYGPHASCPLPAVGLRQITNQTMNPVFPNFPILPYGRYLFTMAFIDKKGEVFGVLAIDGEAVPKL